MTSVDNVLNQLQQRGERITIQRRLVVEALCQGGEHLTIGDIQRYIMDHGHRPDESTIYRILQWLKDAGVVSQTDMGSRGIVYQLIGAPPHHHLVCLGCGAIIGLDDRVGNLLRETLRRDYRFEARVDHLAIFGWCAECQQARDDQGFHIPG
jgi:Fur family transcriptional regulator, ferric uptake regulator